MTSTINSYVLPSPPPTPFQAYSNCAVCSHKCHQYGRVITYCNHALRMDKTWVKAHYLKGKALHSLSSLEDAKRSLKEAQRLTPNDRMITKALDNLNKYVFCIQYVFCYHGIAPGLIPGNGRNFGLPIDPADIVMNG